MKILIKKLKNASKPMLVFYLICLLGYLISYIFFAKSILSLTGIENLIRYIVLGVLGVWLLLYLNLGLITLIKKAKKTFIALSIITFLFIPIFSISSYYIDFIYNKLGNFTQSDTSTYTSVLLTLKDSEITSSSKLGMINNENDREGFILAKELIAKEKLTNEITSYDDFLIMLTALYNKEIDGIFISGNYKILFGSEEKFQKIAEETKVVYSFSKEMKTEESGLTNTKSLTEPFTVLVLGVDSESQGGLNPNAAFNGDTLMLATFNPNTVTATMFSIPRDMFVPIACNNNRYNRINSAAAYGTSCVINTIQNLTDVKIDYFVKVNFKGVVDLVDALGGIEVDVEAPTYLEDKYNGQVCEQDSQRRFGENLVCMTPGENVHLNGEQALAYARCRHMYLESDIARNRHQQAIMEAVAKKLVQNASFSDFGKLLDTISKNTATNMKTTQILSFYQTIKNMLINSLNGEDFMTVKKTFLEYYNLPITYPSVVSALGYYSGSMSAISKGMKQNLGLEKVETIKSFNYDYNNDNEYTIDIIGKGIRTGERLQLMPNLSGQSISYAENWASKNGITLSKEFVESSGTPGIIINQSLPQGAFLKNYSKVIIYISKAGAPKPPVTTPEDPEDPKDPTTPENPETPEDPKDPVVPGNPTDDKEPTT